MTKKAEQKVTDAFSKGGTTGEVDWENGDMILSLLSVILSLRFLRNEMGSWKFESVIDRAISQTSFKHR